MNDIKRRVKDFLKRNEMDYESIDIKRISDLLDDMQKGLMGNCLICCLPIPMSDEMALQ